MNTWFRVGLKPISSTMTLWAKYNISKRRVNPQKAMEGVLMDRYLHRSKGLMFSFSLFNFYSYFLNTSISSSFKNSSGFPLTLAIKLRLCLISATEHFLRRYRGVS